MYGQLASAPAQYAIDVFRAHGVSHVLDLGAGQGRDSLALLEAGFAVTALDYAESGLRELRARAQTAGTAQELTVAAHDVRLPLPLPDSSVDAVFSHMLFCMALTTAELVALSAEVARVLRPGGLHVYTVRHVGDAHYGQGPAHGDDRYESGDFIVHFFDRDLVDELAAGFEVLEVVEFEEGELPRRLWRITERRESSETPAR
jgi:SAM-dependent methyltransferase